MRFDPRNLTRFEKLMLVSIIVGILFRIISALNRDIYSDGAIYVAYADAISEHGDIYLEWGRLWPFGSNHSPGYSHWFPPLHPMYLALWITAFGFQPIVLKTANIVISILTLVLIYYCSKDLLDRNKALAVTAIMAMQPVLIISTAHSFSENIVVLTYVAAVWAILKGFRHPKYLILGGFLAGLCYLSRSNVGYLFILIGVVGLAWRFYYDGWDLFKNKYYIASISMFTLIFGSWTLRNIMHFGLDGWETNPIITEMFVTTLDNPMTAAWATYTTLLSTLILFLPMFIFFMPEWALALKRWREEYFGGLFIASLLPFVITGMFMIACWVWALEEMSLPPPTIWLASVRYLVITTVPMLWIGFSIARFTKKDKKIWWDRTGKSGSELNEPWLDRFRGKGKKRAKRIWNYWQFQLVVVLSFIIAFASVLNPDAIHGFFILIGVTAVLLFESAKRKVTLIIAMLLVVCILVASDPVHEGHVAATEKLNTVMDDNSTVAVDMGTVSTIYIIYPYYERRDQVPVYYDPYLFDLEREYARYLVEGQVSETLRQAFLEQDEELSSEAAVRSIEDRIWMVGDGKNDYKVHDLGSHLNVYEYTNTTFILYMVREPVWENKSYRGYVPIGRYETYHVLGIDLPPYQDSSVWYVFEKEDHYIRRGGTEARDFGYDL